jgi:hypothetical protein
VKKHELAESALEHPELFTPAELTYFAKWLESRRARKEAKKQHERPYLDKFTKRHDQLQSSSKLSPTMTVTTEDNGNQNMWAKEPTMYYENYGMLSPNEVKEQTNGRWAMVGIVAGFISYAITGKFFFGIF